MNRYNTIPTQEGNNSNLNSQDKIVRYITTKYPEISRSFEDVYVYTAMGDRYDTLALSYYNDSTLWWIISSANPEYGKDSLIPPRGIQLRIPSPNRVLPILAEFESLNTFDNI